MAWHWDDDPGMLSDSSQAGVSRLDHVLSKFPSQGVFLKRSFHSLAAAEIVQQVEKPVYGTFHGPFLDFMGLSRNLCVKGP